MRPLAVLAIVSSVTSAATLHVSPSGSDANPGTAERPLLTPAAARDKARTLPAGEPREIILAPGEYHLAEPLVLDPRDSGGTEAPVVWKSAEEGKAVLSGGTLLDLKWAAGENGVFSAPTPAGLVLDQLFVEGARMPMARYPNEDPSNKTAAWQGYAADAFSKERAARWADPAGGFIHAMHVKLWGGYHYRITGKDAKGEVTYEGGWQNNRPMGMHPQFRMVENIREELDAPGEWFHDAKANRLFFMPPAGMNPSSARFEGVRLASLIEFRGTVRNPVKNISFNGFTLRHTARTFMENKEPLLRSDWTIYRGGAVLCEGAEDITVRDCSLDQPGGNGVFASGYNRRITVRGCIIRNPGANAIAFVGKPESVRNPLFRYENTQDLLATDRGKGPKTPDYPADCAVEDCLIQGAGRIERQSTGVEISMAARIAIRDTTIHDCSRAGINISEGTFGGHLIERCDVFDTVLETDDHGSFNSWGRDRFWHPDRNVTNAAVAKRPDLPLLDVVEPITIRYSRWRCDHGWDIDLDDGSSNYEIHHNLLLHGGLKFREGYHRKAWNNILVNNGFHPHVWYDNSDSRFERNIIMRAPKPIGMPAGWESAMTSNFLATTGAAGPAPATVGGAGSLQGDPGFIDPASGDFRVRDGSPALKTGFENFPMDRFGVKKPALRKLAGNPVIPALAMEQGKEAPQPFRMTWRGATLVDLTGEQFSAFGTKREDGGVVLENVPDGSAAAKGGLRTNDLIQGANGRRVTDLADFCAALTVSNNGGMKFAVVRNQSAPKTIDAGRESETWQWQGAEKPDASLVPLPRMHAECRPSTVDEPLATLFDGKLATNYGPVFGNETGGGTYRIALPADAPPLRGLELWSHNQNGNRGRFLISIATSDKPGDPGWNPAGFKPLAGFDGRKLEPGTFNRLRLSLAVPASCRWILIRTHPVTGKRENTAFQEIRPIFAGIR